MISALRPSSIRLSSCARALALFVAIVVMHFTACAPSRSQFSSLVNQGMIPVSAENPYVGSNLFLAKEMERSAYLYNFFRAKGGPQAIELRGRDEDSLEVFMYYAARREMYVARPYVDEKFKTKEWIVRGPYGLDRSAFRAVTRLSTTDVGVFEVFGRREHFGTADQAPNRVVIAPAFVPTATPTPRPIVKPKIRIVATPAPTPEPPPMNSDQRAIQESKHPTLAPGVIIPGVIVPPKDGPAIESNLPIVGAQPPAH